MPPEPPAFDAFGTRNGGDRGADPMANSGSPGEGRLCAPRSSTKHSPRGLRMGSAAGAGMDISSSGGNAVVAPSADSGRVPTTPALLSSMSSARSSSSGVEANGIVKQGPWGMEDGDFGATMIGLGREE